MNQIFYIDRQTKKVGKERVYGKFFLDMLYGKTWASKVVAPFFLPLVSRCHIFSRLYGAMQKTCLSRCKIPGFIRTYEVDETEFADPVDSFRSFNDFFIRKLKASSRPIASGNDVAVLPADGRCLVFDNISTCDGFVVKGVKFSLEEFLADRELAQQYQNGAMAIIRLCPSDYHRFHFPITCVPQESVEIKGALYSVNPMALKKDSAIFSKNKRVLTKLVSKSFGTVLFVEVGATYVGTVHQTFIPAEPYAKGDEKGYFSFGGSCIVLLFEPGRIQFDQDLLEASQKKIEIRALMGQTLGRSLTPF
jgi:phosphatidylserine decarboxylase